MSSNAELSAASGTPRETLGRYRLVKEIAQGGMGSVYLARVSGPGGFEKVVALKRIHEHMAKDPKFITMFLDEAQIAARIHHPNVCGVIDFGHVEGSYYLTMPYIFGRPLNQVIQAAAARADGVGRKLPTFALRLLADACEGLHAAHELRDEAGAALEVVHRDVSPQNLLVGYDGVVRVLDFGVASAKHRHYETHTGEVKGKFAYCSPEHVAAQRVDRRADVWSLGVVLWETLTQRRLFMQDNVLATIRAVADMPIPLLSAVDPDIPESIQAICDRALARDIEQRYPTARAMGRDLLRALAALDDVVAAPDVAEWMQELFPGALAQEEAMIEATRTGDIALASSDGRVSTVALESAAPVVPSGDPERRSMGLMILGGVALATTLVAGFVSAWVLLKPTDENITAVELGGEANVEPAAPVVDEEQTGEAGDPVAIVERPEEPAVEPVEPPSAGGEGLGPSETPPRGEVAGPPAGPTHAVRDPRPARAVARPPGRLSVAPEGGWALVYFRGRRLGDAPGVFELPSGNQVVHVQPFGQGPLIPRRVTIPPGGTGRLRFHVR